MLGRDRQLKNHGAEANAFRRRALVGFVVVLLMLIGLGGWYFRLQVLQHAEFATRSEANRLRLVPVVPARGLILDRKGRILADNVAEWRLDAVPERAGNGEAQQGSHRGRILVRESRGDDARLHDGVLCAERPAHHQDDEQAAEDVGGT